MLRKFEDKKTFLASPEFEKFHQIIWLPVGTLAFHRVVVTCPLISDDSPIPKYWAQVIGLDNQGQLSANPNDKVVLTCKAIGKCTRHGPISVALRNHSMNLIKKQYYFNLTGILKENSFDSNANAWPSMNMHL